MSDFVTKPCKNCPFCSDVKPFLRTERAEDLAAAACNPWNTFPCHETTVSDDESEDGEMMEVETTKVCAGFLSIMHNENDETPYDEDGFVPSPRAYESAYEMIDAYEEANNEP